MKRRGVPVKEAIAALTTPEPPKDAAIRLQFVLGSGIASRLVAWYGQGYGGYSHVDAILPDGSLLGARSDAVGGQPPGVRIRPPNYEKWTKRTVVQLAATQGQARAWEAWLRGQVGKKYDQDAILGFLFGKRLHEEGHWICSACQFDGLRAGLFVADSPWPASECTPNTLLWLVTAGLRGEVK